MNDPYIQCPYNRSHRVPRSRIQGHIVKCQERYPELKICPYNATHRMSEEELRDHVKNCPSRIQNFSNPREVVTGALTTPKPILQKEYLPETDPNYEMWDDECNIRN